MEAQEFNMFKVDFFNNINSYKQELAISKVIKYFERFDIEIPKTTIQNFVRNEVISELLNKRYYTKLHILQIVIALMYKDTFSLSEIKIVNKEIFKQCLNREVNEVFYEIFKLNNDLDEYEPNDTYLDIIYYMTCCIYYKKGAISKMAKYE